MSLGTFGSVASKLPRPPSGGSAAQGDLMDEAIRRQLPSPEGMPALSQQLAQYLASYGENMFSNGSVESWSGGTSAAPDGWTLSGAGATTAQNATNVQDRLYSADVTAALNTVTRLSQTIAISATQNTRLRSQQVVLSARVKVATAGRVSVELDDGVLVTASPIPHTGSGVFETIVVTMTVDSAATQIKASLLIAGGASITATVDCFKLEEGATATTFSPNIRDFVIAISNFQSSTPTNFGDQGVWRMEVGEASLAGDVAVTFVNKTITYATAFRTARGVLLGAGAVVGGRRVTWRAEGSAGASTFVLRAETEEDAGSGALFADTTSGTCVWAMIGQV